MKCIICYPSVLIGNNNTNKWLFQRSLIEYLISVFWKLYEETQKIYKKHSKSIQKAFKKHSKSSLKARIR